MHIKLAEQCLGAASAPCSAATARSIAAAVLLSGWLEQ